MSRCEGAPFLSKSTFLPPHNLDNLTDTKNRFEEWLHSNNSDDIRRYKALMMPPKNRNLMLHDAHLQQQQGENETVEFDYNANVDEVTNINNTGDIEDTTLTELANI